MRIFVTAFLITFVIYLSPSFGHGSKFTIESGLYSKSGDLEAKPNTRHLSLFPGSYEENISRLGTCAKFINAQTTDSKRHVNLQALTAFSQENQESVNSSPSPSAAILYLTSSTPNSVVITHASWSDKEALKALYLHLKPDINQVFFLGHIQDNTPHSIRFIGGYRFDMPPSNSKNHQKIFTFCKETFYDKKRLLVCAGKEVTDFHRFNFNPTYVNNRLLRIMLWLKDFPTTHPFNRSKL